MILFKIKSDPYKRNIEFQSIEPYTKKSVKISEADNCDLASDEIIHGFFPYNVKRIVDEIYEMKSKPGEQVHIVFEGTDDEYDELMDLCSEDEYKDKIILEPQEHHLNSAKEILPRISSIFQDMQPLIEESVHSSERVAQNRRKFEESVDKQKVPICVIGNYSSGKSTFINALVGKEILPSGDDPVTDCVYKIERSQNATSGDVTFNYHGLPITISINEHSKGFGCKITGAGKSNDELINTIQEKTNEQGDQSVHVRINSILAIIESYKKKQKRMNASSGIDSLISITIPFSKEGVLSQSQFNYVIFDTPGEGSATNLDHTLILEKQMKSLSNGLILFITDNKSLDKVEGKSLCEKLIGMECFDNRFTMVIANRADCAKLPREGFLEEDIEDKINQTVCKTLHSNRIFYVSSIVGLGAKQDETFIDEDYQDVYDKERESYTNPEAKHPKSLYRYNIVPEQIKNRCLEWSKAETNKAFANSGLFWIEEEIREFAETYSPYNKCTQSKRFLDEIILETNKRIDESQVNFEASKQTLNEKLMVEEKECVTLLENSAQVLCATYAQNYPTPEMETIKQNSLLSISEGVLRQRQTELETNSKNAHNYAELEADAKLFKNEEATQGENQQQSITNNDIFSSVFSLSKIETYSKIGVYLAKYYSNSKYEERILTAIITSAHSPRIAVDYVCNCSDSSLSEVYMAIEYLRKEHYADEFFVAFIAVLPFDEKSQPYIRELPDESAKKYWSYFKRYQLNNKDLLNEAIMNLLKYSNWEILYLVMREHETMLSVDEILTIVSDSTKKMVIENHTISNNEAYDIEKMLSIVYKRIDNEYENYPALFELEIRLFNVLGWEKMKCCQFLFAKNANYYADILLLLHNKESSEDKIPHDKYMTFYSLEHDIKFCPGATNNTINTDTLNSWINAFRIRLTEVGQELLFYRKLGKLFDCSPIGNDGLFPHEAIREKIEEIGNDELIHEFAFAIIYRRGMYTVTAGKDEYALAQKYDELRKKHEIRYPKTSKIFDIISNSYMNESIQERYDAENEIF